MVEIKSSIGKQKPKEDKSELLNSTVSSEVHYEDIRKCSVWCTFIYACLFIIYLFLVILLSWILRAYLYSHFKRFLRIENIHELSIELEAGKMPHNSINHPSIAYLLSKNKPNVLELDVDSLVKIEDGETPLSHLEVDQIDHSILQFNENLPSELDGDVDFMKKPSLVNGVDKVTGILDNMTDLIISELEYVEEALRVNKENLDSSINMNDLDLFSDSIINNITSILEDEINLVEDALKQNTEHTEREFLNKNFADASTGFMGFLADIFEFNNENSESLKRSGALDNDDYNAHSPFSPDASHLEMEPRIDHIETIQESDGNHNNLEASEDVVLSNAVESIRNLFREEQIKNQKNPSISIIPLIYEQQHNKFKTLFLAYLEIFGLVLAMMSLLTFMLMFIILRCINMQNESKVFRDYKLQENINAKDDHVI